MRTNDNTIWYSATWLKLFFEQRSHRKLYDTRSVFKTGPDMLLAAWTIREGFMVVSQKASTNSNLGIIQAKSPDPLLPTGKKKPVSGLCFQHPIPNEILSFFSANDFWDCFAIWLGSRHWFAQLKKIELFTHYVALANGRLELSLSQDRNTCENMKKYGLVSNSSNGGWCSQWRIYEETEL